MSLAQMALDGGNLPRVAVARPHVLLITTPDALHGTDGADPSRLDGVGPVSPDTARQVCCDADLTPIVIDRNGAAANRCQIHHIRWWRHLGRTDLDNLTLLCWSCHHNIHHNHWTITTKPDGGYTANPPDPNPDPPGPSDARHTP